MASKPEKEKRALSCGELLVDFANAESAKEARRNLYINFKERFYPELFIGPKKGSLQDSFRKEIDNARRDVSRLFSELIANRNLKDCDSFS